MAEDWEFEKFWRHKRDIFYKNNKNSNVFASI